MLVTSANVAEIHLLCASAHSVQEPLDGTLTVPTSCANRPVNKNVEKHSRRTDLHGHTADSCDHAISPKLIRRRPTIVYSVDMTDVNEDVTASSTSTEETKTLLEGLTPMVAEVRDDITAGKPPAHSIGKLKMLDKVLESTKGTPTAAGLKLMFEVCELCLLLLPEDTRKVQRKSVGGGD